MNRKTFYFNTGVRPYIHNPPIKLSKGQIVKGGTIQIPFDCEDVPDNAVFQFACDYETSLDDSEKKFHGIVVRPIINSTMLSKFAYFRIQS